MTSLKNLFLPFLLLLSFIVLLAISIVGQLSTKKTIPLPPGLKPSPTSASPTPLLTLNDNFFVNAKLIKLAQLETTGQFVNPVIAPDNNLLYLPNISENSLFLINAKTAKFEDKINIAGPWTLAFSENNKRIYLAQKSGITILSSDKKVLGFIPTASEPTDLLLSKNDKLLIVFHSQNLSLTIVDIKTSKIIAVVPLDKSPAITSQYQDLIYFSDSKSSLISVFSLDSLKIVGQLKLPSAITGFSIDKNRGRLYGVQANGLLTITDLLSNSPNRTKVFNLKMPSEAFVNLMYLENTDYLLILGERGTVVVFNTQQNKIVKIFNNQSSILSSERFQKILATQDLTPTIFLLNDTGQKLQVYSLVSQ